MTDSSGDEAMSLSTQNKPTCEQCGSHNVALDGWDIDKCLDCGHWRYRGQEACPVCDGTGTMELDAAPGGLTPMPCPECCGDSETPGLDLP